MPKLVKYGIIICAVVVAAFAGYAIYKKGNFHQSFVKEINRNLSPEDRKTYEDRVTAGEQAIANAQSDDDKFGLYVQQGFNLDALGRLSDAQEAFEQAIKLKPEDYRGYAGLYQVQVDRGDYQGALASIRTATEKNPLDPNVWKNYASLQQNQLHASNDVISALYSEAVNKTNSNIDIITAYASWLESAGNLQASKEYWQKAIELNPAGKKLYQGEIDKIEGQMQPGQ